MVYLQHRSCEFWQSQVTYFSLLSLELFFSYLRKHCWICGRKDYSHTLFWESYARPVIHLESILCRVWGRDLVSFLCTWVSSCVSTMCWGKTSFPRGLSRHTCWKSLIMVCFWTLGFIPLIDISLLSKERSFNLSFVPENCRPLRRLGRAPSGYRGRE